ncbi:TIGR02391 family protein [Herminiimonas contaminans]|uniref:TIGR02391 family protein n=1 Tax=Herminiimonas contaminans TaxID=1111140 RepID=UPI0038996716
MWCAVLISLEIGTAQVISDSEKNEQRGFATILRGLVGMFWNITAHEHASIGRCRKKMLKTCCRSYF